MVGWGVGVGVGWVVRKTLLPCGRWSVGGRWLLVVCLLAGMGVVVGGSV